VAFALKIEKPIHLVSDGLADQEFFRRLLAHMGLTDRIGSMCVRGENGRSVGRSGLAAYLEGSVKTAVQFSPTVRGVMVIIDSEDDHGGSWNYVTDALAATGFPRPSQPMEIVQGNVAGRDISVAASLMPSHDADGCLETLLRRSLEPRFTGRHSDCIASYRQCLFDRALISDWTAVKQDKLWMTSFIAGTYKRNPGKALDRYLTETDCIVPWDDPAFTSLRNFIAAFSAAV
jgi:hypothetical protein